MAQKIDVIEIIALANAAAGIVAYFIDQARASGATPEQIAQLRQDAVARYDRAAAAVDASEPPPLT